MLEFKSAHPIDTIFDKIRFGWFFLTISRYLAQYGTKPSRAYEKLLSIFQRNLKKRKISTELIFEKQLIGKNYKDYTF